VTNGAIGKQVIAFFRERMGKSVGVRDAIGEIAGSTADRPVCYRFNANDYDQQI
jgi:hypothetical protein